MPSRNAGEKGVDETASTADFSKKPLGEEDKTEMSRGTPSAPTMNCNTKLPETPFRRARQGYSGELLFFSFLQVKEYASSGGAADSSTGLLFRGRTTLGAAIFGT